MGDNGKVQDRETEGLGGGGKEVAQLADLVTKSTCRMRDRTWSPTIHALAEVTG